MSIVRKTKESHEHKGRRVTLRKLEKEIAGFESVQLGPSELERVKVTTRPMFLDETGMSKFEPCFFRPAQPKLFGAPDDVWFPDYDREPGIQGFEAGPMDRARDLYSYVNEYLLWCYEVGEMTTSRWCSRSDADYNCYQPLYETSFGRPDREWETTSTASVTGYPHMRCSMVSDVNADDRLLRSELLYIVRIMAGRLNMLSLVEHMMTPVLLFSYVGPQHGRILQAHFDGDNIVVFQSGLYDFRHRNDAATKLFSQWALSGPVGDTL